MNGASTSTAAGAMIGTRPAPIIWTYGGRGFATVTHSGATPADLHLVLRDLIGHGRRAIA